MTDQRHIGLRSDACSFLDCFSFGDQDLGAHNIDAGHLFGDGVFDLNAWVHLNEVESAGVHIHQEFDRACAFIVYMRTNLATQFTNFGPLFLG